MTDAVKTTYAMTEIHVYHYNYILGCTYKYHSLSVKNTMHTLLAYCQILCINV